MIWYEQPRTDAGVSDLGDKEAELRRLVWSMDMQLHTQVVGVM